MKNRVTSVFAGLLLFAATWTPSSRAQTTFEPDCQNYCSFRELEHPCQGIRFKKVFMKNGKEDAAWQYTHWSPLLRACVYNRLYETSGPKDINVSLRWRKVSPDQIKKACSCDGSVEPVKLPDAAEPMSEQTAQELRALREKVEGWAQCAPDPLTIPAPADDQHPYKPSDMKSCRQMKAEGKKGYIVLGACVNEGDPDCSYYGNTNNISGPYCLFGDTDRCEDVRAAQDSATGAWYRNAFQRRFPQSEKGQPLFSRDEVLGVMAYLVKTKDTSAAEKWLRFLVSNPRKRSFILEKIKIDHEVVDFCPPDGPVTADDRCEMRPDTWALMGRVYRYIGMSDERMKEISAPLYRKMMGWQPVENLLADLSARTVPAVGGGSYQESLQATHLTVLRYMDGGGGFLVDNTAKVIDRRTMKASPYYHWLALGGHASEYGASLIKKFCPVERPHYGLQPDGTTAIAAASFFDAAVQTFGGSYNGQRDFPVGHDCIGWINLYLSDSRRAKAAPPVSTPSPVDLEDPAPSDSPTLERLRSGVNW